MRTGISKYGKLEVKLNEEDQCYSCGHLANCPLVGALKHEVVIPHYENFHVQVCGMYKDIPQNNKTILDYFKKGVKTI